MWLPPERVSLPLNKVVQPLSKEWVSPSLKEVITFLLRDMGSPPKKVAPNPFVNKEDVHLKRVGSTSF